MQYISVATWLLGNQDWNESRKVYDSMLVIFLYIV